FVLNTASGISVLTGYTLAISQDHTYAVDSITANTTGNVLTNETLRSLVERFEIPFELVSHEGLTREEHDTKMADAIDAHQPD
ncbi:hypothetical protein ONQ97_27560, partial [Salmonella enterica subsp. enterica serovar Virginia]|nr:hypothetical protein [Salmonella enterica subsp. enterica serovar Virginia]